MARTSNLTEALVHETARKLDAQGVKPTIRAIRDVIGEGSLTTIARMMQTYEAESHEGAIEAPDYPESMTPAFGALWREAFAVCAEMFATERGELEIQKAQAEALAEQLGKTADEIEAERDQLAAQVASQTRTIEKLVKSEGHQATEIRAQRVAIERQEQEIGRLMSLLGKAPQEPDTIPMDLDPQPKAKAKAKRKASPAKTASAEYHERGLEDRTAPITMEQAEA
jgi:hypothetical protein